MQNHEPTTHAEVAATPSSGAFEERLGALFVPDLISPSQYFDRLRGGTEAQSGERKLLVAVLEDAVITYLKHAGATRPAHQALFREAEEWIEDDDRARLFSFATICEHIGLEPSQLRRGLRARKARVATAERPVGPRAADDDAPSKAA